MRTHPSASELISVIIRQSHCSAQLQNNHLQLAASVYQIAQHKQSTMTQINQQVGDFWHKPAYGKAPWAKPDDCIQIIMENFNSLGAFTNNTKINTLIKFWEFNTNVLAGCKTQVD
jgi:hypothetical protein